MTAYAKSIGPVEVSRSGWISLRSRITASVFRMRRQQRQQRDYLDQKIAECDSVGGVVECVISGLPVGLGEPVFEKLDANLAKAIPLHRCRQGL